jgi:hypothetical protein
MNSSLEFKVNKLDLLFQAFNEGKYFTIKITSTTNEFESFWMKVGDSIVECETESGCAYMILRYLEEL